MSLPQLFSVHSHTDLLLLGDDSPQLQGSGVRVHRGRGRGLHCDRTTAACRAMSSTVRSSLRRSRFNSVVGTCLKRSSSCSPAENDQWGGGGGWEMISGVGGGGCEMISVVGGGGCEMISGVGGGR